MKMIVAVALALVAVAAAAPVETPAVPQILRSSNEQTPEGGFAYSFETENGINTNADGQLKTVNDEDNKPQIVVVVRGSYSYPGEDGKPIVVNYFADETGYHAEGDSIPKPARREV